MKAGPWVLALLATVAGGVAISAADRGPSAAETILDAPATDYAATMRDFAKGGFLDWRYELVATVSAGDRCLAVTATGEARTLVDKVQIGWCGRPGSAAQDRDLERPLLARVEVSTHLLPQAPRERVLVC